MKLEMPMTTRRARALAVFLLLLGLAACRHGGAMTAPLEEYGRGSAGAASRAEAGTVLSRRQVEVPFSFVADAELVTSQLFGAPAKTLLLRFAEPQTVLSSLSGWHEGILAVGNHYFSPPSWPITHDLGMEKTEAQVLELLGLDRRSSALLYTGADMDNFAYAEKSADGLRVGVLATAGVKGNALRASVDSGAYVEPGTINLIILTSRKLTPSAMSGALIIATEAKTAALEDLDIRSSYSGTPATGTGTDNILVVAGDGPAATMTGGHTKLGELLGKAVHAAVSEAVAKQNQLHAGRDIFQRLEERKIIPAALFAESGRLRDAASRNRLAASLGKTLREPRYAGFMAGALALSDSFERGLVRDTGTFSTLCLAVAGELAGKRITKLEPVIMDEGVPAVIREALNALATGLLGR